MTAVLPGQAGMPVTLPPRIPLAVLPTPLLPAPRLASALGIGELLIKRDDLTGFAFAGNKARPLGPSAGERTRCSPGVHRARTSARPAPPPRSARAWPAI
jgi:hypothetical protein